MEMEVFTGVVLLDNQARVYLIKEEDKNKINEGRWNFPGGSIDEGERLIEAAEREVWEETGYQAKVTSMLGLYQGFKGKKSWLYVVLQAKLKSAKKSRPIDSAVKKGRWFKKEEFLKMRNSAIVNPEMKLVYKAALAGGGLSLKAVKAIRYDRKKISLSILLRKIFKRP